MKITNPFAPIVTLIPAVAVEKASGIKKASSDLLYNNASAVNQCFRFTTFKVVGADDETLIGSLALVDDGVWYEFPQANQNTKFAFVRDCIAFISFTEKDGIDIVPVDGKGKFNFGEHMGELTPEQLAFAKMIDGKVQTGGQKLITK